MRKAQKKWEDPPLHATQRESTALLRALGSAMTEALSAALNDTYAAILLEKPLPAVSRLFSALARAECQHYCALSALLRDLGACHAPRISHTTTPYRLNGDADDSSACTVAHRMLQERAAQEQRAITHYKHLQQAATTECVRARLTELAKEKEEHLSALSGMEKRLALS